jgi:hypothetical protein
MFINTNVRNSKLASDLLVVAILIVQALFQKKSRPWYAKSGKSCFPSIPQGI